MQESQQRLLDEQLQLSLDTNKTGLSISSHDSQIDLLEQYTKVCDFWTKNYLSVMVRRTPNRRWSLFDRSTCSDCPKSLSSPNTEQSEHIFFDSEQGEQSELPLKFDVFLRLSKLFQKYNLLFFGLAEEPDEDPEQLVRNILQTKMDIILKDKDIEFAEVRIFLYIQWQKNFQSCMYKSFQKIWKVCFELPDVFF